MPRTVKLSSADARAWRENRAQWVSAKGQVLRPVTSEEEAAIFPVMRRVEQFKQSGSAQVAAVYKVPDAKTGQVTEQRVPMEVVVRVTRTGRDQNAFLYDTFVNGNRYVKGRDVLRARILEKHGECILQGPNGKQICVLRDPRVNRPTFGESQRNSPTPDRCHCRGFKDNPDVGRHHIACEWNAKAPPHERALPIQREGMERGMLDLQTPIANLQFDAAGANGSAAMIPIPRQQPMHANGRVISAPTAAALPQGGVAAMAVPVVMSGPGIQPAPAYHVPPPPPPLYTAPQAPAGVTVAHTPQASVVQRTEEIAAPIVSPKDCENDCRGITAGTRGWAWPSGRKPEPNQHHPLCKFESAWREHLAGEKRWMLYDMDRGVELREATPDERARAEVEAQRNGIRSVQVGEYLFAVVEAGSTPQIDPGGVPTNLAGTKIRPSPDQTALRAPPAAPSAGTPPVVTGRPAAKTTPGAAAAPSSPREMTLEELEQELARRRALAAMPAVPAPGDVTAEDELPDGADAMDESVEAEGEPTWGEDVAVVAEAEVLPPPAANVPLAGEAAGLRDSRGLVGLQQRDSTIEKGPVTIVDPEPFVDPMEPEVLPLSAAAAL